MEAAPMDGDPASRTLAAGPRRALLDIISTLCIISNMGEKKNLGAFLRGCRERQSIDTPGGRESHRRVERVLSQPRIKARFANRPPRAAQVSRDLRSAVHAYVGTGRVSGSQCGKSWEPAYCGRFTTGPISSEEESALRQYLDFLRSRRA